MSMDSTCVYEEKTVIHELSQGLQMAEQLRVNLHSPEARDFFIQMILSSYNNALSILQSGHSVGQPPAPALLASSLPGSSISFGSPRSEGFVFNQPFSSQQGDTVVSPFSFPSTSFGPIEDFDQLRFPNYYENELSQIYSPSLDFPIDLSNVDPGFESNNCFF